MVEVQALVVPSAFGNPRRVAGGFDYNRLLLILAVLVRAILGPRFTDRIIAVNVINTLVVALLVVLSVWMSEDFLVDVALIYALLSFLTVVVVSRLVLTRRQRHKEDQRREQRRRGTRKKGGGARGT